MHAWLLQFHAVFGFACSFGMHFGLVIYLEFTTHTHKCHKRVLLF